MDNNNQKSEVRQSKDAVIEDILVAYREAAVLSRKPADTEMKEAIHFMHHGFDVILQRLLPLEEAHEKRWNEIRSQFTD